MQAQSCVLHAAIQSSLTEYTPRERGAPLAQPAASATPTQTASNPPPQQEYHESPNPAQIQQLSELVQQASSFLAPQQVPSQIQQFHPQPSDSSLPDPSTLPPALAPESAPHIDPTATGTYSVASEGKEEEVPIFDVEIESLAEKNWRRPGSDLSDWFNYGFDEISWEAYCVQRRDMAALAAEMKANVLVRWSAHQKSSTCRRQPY